jgi:hypothetical protein
MASDTTPPINPHSLVEVRTLKALPNDLNALLGRQKNGPEGIADAGEQFNRMTEVPKTPQTIGANAVKAACAAAEPRPCIGNSVEN